MVFAIAKKLGMTTIYEEGKAQNVTLLEVGKNIITKIRTEKKDGHSAAQVGLVNSKEKKEKSKKKYFKITEFKIEDTKDLKEGQEIEFLKFEKGQKLTIQGVTKGKGFQGVVKRHGFAGSPASHGHRHDLRAPGSIGSAFPERVMKGKKMAGRMGSDKKTIKKAKVVFVDAEKRIVAIKGAIPGSNGSVIKIFEE